jgi:hypothetical protein
MAVAILDAFVRVAPLPGVAFVALEPPGVMLEIQVALASQPSPAAQLLGELMVAEARRAGTLI